MKRRRLDGSPIGETILGRIFGLGRGGCGGEVVLVGGGCPVWEWKVGLEVGF